jgi:hypothetical protein
VWLGRHGKQHSNVGIGNEWVAIPKWEEARGICNGRLQNLISTHVNWKCIHINYKSWGNMCQHFYLTCVEIRFCCKLQQFCCPHYYTFSARQYATILQQHMRQYAKHRFFELHYDVIASPWETFCQGMRKSASMLLGNFFNLTGNF